MLPTFGPQTSFCNFQKMSSRSGSSTIRVQPQSTNMPEPIFGSNEDTISLSSVSTLSPSVTPPPQPQNLVRNTYIDSVTDYVHFFDELHIKEGFRYNFFDLMMEHLETEAIEEHLKIPEEDTMVISKSFPQKYGNRVWMRRGKNNQQDPLFRELSFQWKYDEAKYVERHVAFMVSRRLTID